MDVTGPGPPLRRTPVGDPRYPRDAHQLHLIEALPNFNGVISEFGLKIRFAGGLLGVASETQ